MQPPAEVNGYPITARGVHLQPNGLHNFWMEDERRDTILAKMRQAGISWVLALSESDNLVLSGAAEALLQHGIIPIIRLNYQFPGPWTHADAFSQFVTLCNQYGAPAIGQFANEPFDPREGGPDWPYPNAWEIIAQRWHEAADIMINAGGYAMFPDGPCYSDNPFSIIGDEQGFWADGLALYGYHGYGKGRPYNYPEDDVSRNGTPLTWDEYVAALDYYGDDPAWNEGPVVLEMMNAQREAWKDPDKTAVDDPTCWRGWQLVQHYAQEAFGHKVQMALCEGGWQPRDRAGSGAMTLGVRKLDPLSRHKIERMHDQHLVTTIHRFTLRNPSQEQIVEFAAALAIDIRWPYTTPEMVATKTLEMESDRPPEMFAIMPWLWADGFMAGGDVGWPFDAWWTWAYSPPYELYKPVVDTLIANPPSGGGEIVTELQAALADCQTTNEFIQAALDDLRNRARHG